MYACISIYTYLQTTDSHRLPYAGSDFVQTREDTTTVKATVISNVNSNAFADVVCKTMLYEHTISNMNANVTANVVCNAKRGVNTNVMCNSM